MSSAHARDLRPGTQKFCFIYSARRQQRRARSLRHSGPSSRKLSAAAVRTSSSTASPKSVKAFVSASERKVEPRCGLMR